MEIANRIRRAESRPQSEMQSVVTEGSHIDERDASLPVLQRSGQIHCQGRGSTSSLGVNDGDYFASIPRVL